MMTEEQMMNAHRSAQVVRMLTELDLYLLTMEHDEWEDKDIEAIANKVAECYMIARRLTIIRAGYEVGGPVGTEPVNLEKGDS